MKEKLLLIAEKPSLMRDLRDTYNKHKNELPYLIDFVALSGHICHYAKPNEYDEWNKKWDELKLPMVPDKWKIDVISDKSKMYKDIKDKIKTNNYDGYICATDSDREGNLIYHLLETKLGIAKAKAYRMWIHDTTDVGLLKTYKTMVDLHKDNFQRNFTLASVLRSRFDWVIGMNITVDASVKSGTKMLVGRVKSPTLKLVYDNSMAIDNFVPKTTYQLMSKYKDGFSGLYIDEDSVKEFETENEANSFKKNFKDVAIVSSIEKETVKTQAPKLYKLSDLQVEASELYGYSPQKTLDLVQSLYETHKIVSYPRCDCRYVSTSLANEFDILIKNASVIPEFTSVAQKFNKADVLALKSNKKYVNDKEVEKSSHTALVPTSKMPVLSELNADELNIFKMICKRFLSIFLPPMIEEKTVLLADNNGYTFKSNGTIVISKGYTEFTKKNDSSDNILPNLKKGDKINVEEIVAKSKTTTPPARLTEGSIVKEMENIGKHITNAELKQIMKESSGIGTQATRSAIIKQLINEGYIEVKMAKKVGQLYISQSGKNYIENLKGFDIINPELTAIWEQKLKNVAEGEYDAVQFNKDMMEFLNKMISDISKMEMKRPTYEPKKSLGKCPRCGKDIVEGNKSFGCVGYKDNPKCDFSIWKENGFFKSQGKKLSASIVEKLLKDKKVLVKGFKSKKGTKYDAYILLEDTGKGFANLKVEMPERKKK